MLKKDDQLRVWVYDKYGELSEDFDISAIRFIEYLTKCLIRYNTTKISSRASIDKRLTTLISDFDRHFGKSTIIEKINV